MTTGKWRTDAQDLKEVAVFHAVDELSIAGANWPSENMNAVMEVVTEAYNAGIKAENKRMKHQLKTVNNHLRHAEKNLTELYRMYNEA